MGFSPRYTPVTGRLHTRYAPVRRSSPKYCYLALPLDLHVLSLPLAFILSQDQTLHCKNCSFLPFDSSSCLTHISICMSTHAISIFSCYLYLLIISNFSCFLSSFPLAENGCKSTTFFHSGKIFFQFFSVFCAVGLVYNMLRAKVFFRRGGYGGMQWASGGLFHGFFGGIGYVALWKNYASRCVSVI